MENLKTIRATLALFVDGNKLLLGEKKRGFAKGTLNGIGGKQDPGETIDEAMVRECEEEIGVTPIEYENVGKIDFDLWYKGEHSNMEMYIYKCYKFEGEIKETEEILPSWYDINKIPFDKMLPDDLLWLPQVLEGNKIIGKVKLDQNNEMLYHKIENVPQINYQR